MKATNLPTLTVLTSEQTDIIKTLLQQVNNLIYDSAMTEEEMATGLALLAAILLTVEGEIEHVSDVKTRLEAMAREAGLGMTVEVEQCQK